MRLIVHAKRIVLLGVLSLLTQITFAEDPEIAPIELECEGQRFTLNRETGVRDSSTRESYWVVIDKVARKFSWKPSEDGAWGHMWESELQVDKDSYSAWFIGSIAAHFEVNRQTLEFSYTNLTGIIDESVKGKCEKLEQKI